MKVQKIGCVLLMSTVIIGCSSDASSPDESEEMEESADENSEVGEFIFAYSTQPTTLDTHFSTQQAVRDIGRNIYEPLVTINSNYEVEPMLAESYEQSDDGETITFHLREGIQFHNGEEMQANDVVASMEKWQEELAHDLLEGTTYEMEDDYTVVAHIDDPTTLDMANFAATSQLAAIMPEEIVENAGSEGVDEYIGTGPFQFEDWHHDQYIHLSKFEGYQARSEPSDGLAGEKEALINDLYFYFVSDVSTRVSGVQTGEYHAANQISPDNVDILESDQNVEINLITDMFTSLVFNKREGFLSDQTARRAVNAALNVDDLLTGAYGDERFYVRNHGLVLEEQTDWYTNAGEEEYNTYDPELAEQLLEEAGYDGEEIVIITTRDNPDFYDIAVITQQQLENVGMNVTVEEYDRATLAEIREDENAYDILMAAFFTSQTPVDYVFFNSEWPGWTDHEEFDRLIEEIQYADSQDEARQFTAELQQEMWEYLPIIIPGYKNSVSLEHSSVSEYEDFNGPILWGVSVEE